MTDVPIVLRYCKCFTHHAAYEILCNSVLQSLGMSEEYELHEFDFSDKHGRMYDLYFSGRRSHETERIFAANQFYLYANLVEHETILKEQVGM